MVKRSRLPKRSWLRKLVRVSSFPPVRKIVLTRWEGLHAEVQKPVTVKSFAEANRVLDMWRLSAPDYKEGYHKVGFKVDFVNGHGYEGRYDLNKANCRGYADSPTLEGHIAALQSYVQKKGEVWHG